MSVESSKTSKLTSIFDDATSMISIASSMYIFSELRKSARSNKTKLALKDYEPPVDLGKIIIAIKGNMETLQDSMSPNKYEKLESMSQRLRQAHLNKNGGSENLQDYQLVEFVDTECEYDEYRY